MTKRQKKFLVRILIAAVLFTAGMLLDGPAAAGLLLVSYAWIGWDILWRAVVNIRHGEVFDENFLMSIATIGALGLGEFSEGAAVMLFYQLGEWFQSYAVARSRHSIAALMDIRPDTAHVERDGKLLTVSPEEVSAGEQILVRPGERVPIDGTVLAGSSFLDTSALTGEALPREVLPGMEIISGCVNQTAPLTIQTSRLFAESTVSRILELVENASGRKARMEGFITRFARWYTPLVVFAALALALLPPLLLGQPFADWIYRALTFLVISCPCALVISVPLSFFGGIGGASRSGVLVKGSNYLEALAQVDTIVFDKTGTLTQGVFQVSEILPVGGASSALLELAAHVEGYSLHPIGASIRKAYGRELDLERVRDLQEIAGQGLQAVFDSRPVLLGNEKLLRSHGVDVPDISAGGTVIYAAVDGVYAGCLRIEDALKPDAVSAVAALRSLGVQKTVMLTGDSQASGEKAAGQLGLDEVWTGLLPADKVNRVEELLDKKVRGKTLAFVGDGINDAPVLARADVGIAMGGLGSDAAIEAADVVLMTDEPSKIAEAIGIARKTVGIARQNIVFAIGIKLLVLCLGALGAANLWEAVFADVGVCVLAVFNAMRAMRTKTAVPVDRLQPVPVKD